MKVLIVGNGGREHTLAWKIKQSPKVEKLYFTGANAGMEETAESCPVSPQAPFSDLIEFVRRRQIELTIVGPEAPLAEGIVDRFEAEGLRIFGPSQKAATIEASKSFAKEIMTENNIPTGKAEMFSNSDQALKYLRTLKPPLVVKADGLAAGKGVTVARSIEEAEEAIIDNLERHRFGPSSSKILIEECLQGEEASLLAFTDGKTVLPMVSAQDHKPIYDGDKGPNTGGMGAYSPAPVVTPEIYAEVVDRVLKPAINGLAKKGIQYRGVLYAGLMISEDGPKVLEFNCRFGDPENQAILPRLKNDLIDVIEATIDGRLEGEQLEWRPEPAVCVIMASGGYPQSYEKGKVIYGLDKIEQSDDLIIFHAGTKRVDNHVVTNGGRVLGLTTLAPDLERAIDKNYKVIRNIHFKGCHFRTDIGQKALERLKTQ